MGDIRRRREYTHKRVSLPIINGLKKATIAGREGTFESKVAGQRPGVECRWAEDGAGNEVRTRDLNLGKVALYQLSYSRIGSLILAKRLSASTTLFTQNAPKRFEVNDHAGQG